MPENVVGVMMYRWLVLKPERSEKHCNQNEIIDRGSYCSFISMSSALARTFGLSPMWIYTATVRHLFSLDIIVWRPTLKPQRAIKGITNLQRPQLLVIGGVMRRRLLNFYRILIFQKFTLAYLNLLENDTIKT